jgi:hypothetical protein
MEALVPITLFLSIAAVLILRPLTRRLGMLLEHSLKQRQDSGSLEVENASLRLALDQVSKRLELMEDRLDFTERLVAAAQGPLLERGGSDQGNGEVQGGRAR